MKKKLEMSKQEKLVEKATTADERNIKQDNFRKSEISTQKWGETGRFQEIIEETKGGLDFPTTAVKTIQEVASSKLVEDNTMLINLPNDDKRNKWRIDPEPPPSKLIRPGDKQYEALLERAIALNEKTKAEGKNMASSIIPITVACSKHKANIDLINLLELDYVEDGETVLVEIMGIGDSGADT